jgi:hypothetical protein
MPKSHASINRWIREQELRLGIATAGIPAIKSTVTVMLPSMAAVTRVAHAAADERIANDPRYAAMCARLDAELAEILEGVSESFTPLRRAKSTRAPRVLMND